MRVIVWGINYAPEPTGIGPYNTALCEYLASRGHDVEMVTSFQYYPNWSKRAEDVGRIFRTDHIEGVPVHRCWLLVPKKVRTVTRILHELSFVFFSTLRALLLPAPDVYVVVSPPLLLGVAAAFIRSVKGAPFVFHIQDLQPDAAIALGMLDQQAALTILLRKIEAFVYGAAARVSTISGGMMELVRQKGSAKHAPIYFPNGIELGQGERPSGKFRERHGISDKAFLIVYSGNLGLKQGLSTLLQAARILGDSQGKTGDVAFQIVIAGAGANQKELRAQFHLSELKNVLFLPLQPELFYREMLGDADCCAITQKAGTGQIFFPSKLLPALAAGKAILGIADPGGDLERAINEGAFGLSVAPESAEALARAAREMAASPELVKVMGIRGRAYVERFDRKLVLAAFEEELLHLAGRRVG